MSNPKAGTRTPRTWSADQIAVLRAEYPTSLDVEALAQRLGKSTVSLYSKAKDLGLTRVVSPATRAARAAKEEQRQEDTTSIVPAALASRTPIEIAVQQWRAGA